MEFKLSKQIGNFTGRNQESHTRGYAIDHPAITAAVDGSDGHAGCQHRSGTRYLLLPVFTWGLTFRTRAMRAFDEGVKDRSQETVFKAGASGSQILNSLPPEEPCVQGGTATVTISAPIMQIS
ncbi:hypothetical protein SAMN05216403_1029 [Nitrosospira multiformis ATCC 25196]|uniref:Uncharacterized protein n=1 Tax=Nitrosospira multiformis (strain ATCC 25196 / NCIMB 11849 / C 71) TaxID=323848 RepID=A0A1H5S5L1_NITMU|nr:hypothetical protein SAMN05216403_1029 [Nitrosospira multiformis ATCC 25196]